MPAAKNYQAKDDAQFNAGTWVWCEDDEEAWLPGKVTGSEGGQTTVEVLGRGKKKFKDAVVASYDPCGNCMNANLSNLVDLDVFSEGTILHHVAKRFNRDIIYTFVGSILVAANPFQRFNIYGQDMVDKYKALAAAGEPMPPHTYAIASTSYMKMCESGNSQSVLISGESGAGKTETTKQVLQYLAFVAGTPGEMGIAEQILQSNPVLEAFGNAKTLKNNNSSRFGKWMKIDFDPRNNKIHGCRIINYLLEKSRVCYQNPGERSYHSFYQLLAGPTDEERALLQLEGPDAYPYLNKSGCTTIDGVNDSEEQDLMRKAMDILQFSPDEQLSVMKVLAGILALSQVNMAGDDEKSSVAADSQGSLILAAEILGVDPTNLEKSLTSRIEKMGGRGSVVTLNLNLEKATETKDAFAKALYGNMFDWMVSKVNETLFKGETPVHFGVLDIFGFETFEVNSFEQMCINYTNEKLQSHFNSVIFDEEMKMYEAEQVPHEEMTFPDNLECVALIEGRPLGLISLLDEQCVMGKATDETYLNKIDSTFNSKSKTANRYFDKKPQSRDSFSIKHFAGPVTYNVTNFLEKNKDTISSTIVTTAVSSQLPLVSLIFADTSSSPEQKSKKGGKNKGKATLGTKFKNDLSGLMTALHQTEPAFIRCIKSNAEKLPGRFTQKMVLQQLKNGGLFEAIAIRRAGYSYRNSHKLFAQHYAVIFVDLQVRTRQKDCDYRELCQELLTRFGEKYPSQLEPSNWVIGLTKVFLKTSEEQNALERVRTKALEHLVWKLQAIVRGYITRRRIWLEQHAAEEEERLAREAAEREARRLLEEQQKQIASIIKVQTIIRTFVAVRQYKKLSGLREVNRAQQTGSIEDLTNALHMMKEAVDVKDLPSWARSKLADADKQLRRLIEVDDLMHTIEEAKESLDLEVLQESLARAEELGISHYSEVQQAQDELSGIVEKKAVMEKLMSFLKDDSAVANVPELLEQAKDIGVESSFVDRVEDVYKQVAPKLEARNNLRYAVEVVWHDRIIECLNEVKDMSANNDYGPFGKQEIQAAEQMLKMLDFEGELYKGEFPRDEPRLTDAIIELCARVENATDPARKKEAQQDLQVVVWNDAKLEGLVRAYKWRVVYATWLYWKENAEPEDAYSTTVDDDENSFYGMRPGYARYKYNVHMTMEHSLQVPATVQGQIADMNSSAPRKAGRTQERKGRNGARSPRSPSSPQKSDYRHNDYSRAMHTRPAKHYTPVYKQRRRKEPEISEEMKKLELSRQKTEEKRKELMKTTQRMAQLSWHKSESDGTAGKQFAGRRKSRWK